VTPAGPSRGDGEQGAVPPVRRWQDRLDDPREPLYTMAIAADLLGFDVQALRRLEAAAGLVTTRPSGNQRRYSRAELEVLSRAADLSRAGTPGPAIAQILDLERQVSALREDTSSVGSDGSG
jgi:MerR family transcriptional regulator, heat shock protein HspR